MDNAQKLQELRQLMTVQGIDGLLVPRTDEYQGEYVAAYAERLAWLTGFTGSAGVAIILNDKAVVMSDGRYTIQLAQQVDTALYDVENSQLISPEKWLKDNVNEGAVIGYDPKLHTPVQIELKEQQGLILQPLEENLIDKIWQDQPVAPQGRVKLFPEEFAGVSAATKIENIQRELKANGADCVVLTLSDSIAWIFNIRGEDITHIPVVLSYAIIPAMGKAQWFVDSSKITEDVQQTLSDYIEIKDPEYLSDELAVLGKSKSVVWYDPKRSSIWFQKILEQDGAKIIVKDDPCIWVRACKNEVEQKSMKAAHIRDGVALVKFLKWFDENAEQGDLTELSVEEKLESFRADFSEFKEPSFTTIAGYGSNGAIVHYRADEQSSKTIKTGNLLLLDSGAQYEDGTTDITRTLAIGDVTQEMKECFTLVLKGHIALASAKFKKGTVGRELDKLARAPLQAQGLDYMHGTGHGVGCYLSVHEESASISPRGEDAVQAAMIISNEPGYYKEGEYGIRIESLILTQESEEGELYFETITLAPIDKNLTVVEMLEDAEKLWLNNYHTRVYKILAPLLDNDVAEWLKNATAKI